MQGPAGGPQGPVGPQGIQGPVGPPGITCAEGNVLIYKNIGGWYCGNIIPVTNGVGICVNGKCSISGCSSNTADCDSNIENGCETFLNQDKNNCGACGIVCSAGEECSSGKCVTWSGGTFSPSTIIVDSDVAAWTGTPCGTTSTYTVLPDNINVTFNAFWGSPGSPPDTIIVDQVSISYTPSNTGSPSIPSQYQAIGQQVSLGGSKTFPVQVAPISLKKNPPLSNLICSSNIYSYHVTLMFNCRYFLTGRTFTGSVQLNISFADYAE
jgi:hypothetical protein